MIDEEYFLEVHDVVKRFGHVTALDGVSLKAALGEILAIVGDNGAGKSTLIKILTGVLVPDRGRIVIDGKSYLALTPKLPWKLAFPQYIRIWLWLTAGM